MRSTRLKHRIVSALAVGLIAPVAACSSGSSPISGAPSSPSGTDVLATENATDRAEPSRTVIISAHGSRTLPLLRPTLASLMSDPAVSAVITGEIVSSETIVDNSEGGNDVFTVHQVLVDDGAGHPAGSVTSFATLGGLVRLADVRGDFERSGAVDLSQDDLNSWVRYQVQGEEAPVVGDHVLVVQTGDDYATLTHMILKDGRFVWPGEAPNPDWVDSVSGDNVESLVDAFRQAESAR